MRYRFLFAAALALASLAVAACRGEPAPPAPPPLELERILPLDGVPGRIDHLALDPRGRRLFIAELGAGAVEAVELRTGRSLARLNGLKAPQGLGYLPDLDELAVASGGDGTVRFLKAADLAQRALLKLGDDADDVRVDGASRRVLVGYGGGAMAVIDPAPPRAAAEIPLGAHPEGFSLDAAAGHVFVNLPERKTVADLDLRAGRTVRSWRLGLRLANFPMALDAGDGLVAVAFRLPPTLVLYRAADGAETAAAPACGDADDVYFDARRRRFYVSCGVGRIDVLSLDHGRLAPLARIASRPGARTSLFSPELDRLFVAAPSRDGRPAAIQVYRPGS